MKTVDGHWHLYVYEDQQGKDFREVISEAKKRCGVEGINICSIPIYQNLGPAQNLLAALYKLSDPQSYAYGGLVYPQCPLQKPMPDGMDPVSQYRELMEIGFDGIKMLETKPTEQKQYQVRVDDPYYDGLFAACEEDGTHMVWHVADPDSFWDIDRIPKRFLDRGWFFGDGTYLSWEETYAQVYRVLEKHPRLKATFAHFFFLSPKPEKLEEVFTKYPHVGVDITPGAEMYADFRERRDYYREFFLRWADRIQFGTDTSVNGGDMERFAVRLEAVRDVITSDRDVTIIDQTCKGLGLPEQVQEKILYRNFRDAAGQTPKAVDIRALKRYFDKYQHLITDEKMHTFLQKELERL